MCKDLEGAHLGHRAGEGTFPWGAGRGGGRRALDGPLLTFFGGGALGSRSGQDVTLQAWVGWVSSPFAHFSPMPCLVFRCSGIMLEGQPGPLAPSGDLILCRKQVHLFPMHPRLTSTF